MEKFKLKPYSKDIIVRDPKTKEPLKAEGEVKLKETYWLRRLAEGVVVLCDEKEEQKKEEVKEEVEQQEVQEDEVVLGEDEQPVDIDKLKKDALIDLAKSLGIEVAKGDKKEAIIEAIKNNYDQQAG